MLEKPTGEYMKKLLFVVFMAGMACGAAFGRNVTADMLRVCEGVLITDADNYILRCPRNKAIEAAAADGVLQFFVADNGGDVRGSFLDTIPDDASYVYVNVVSNLADSRYKDQTCYRFIREKDVQRDGFYATEICEYDRPDYYL